MNVFDKHQLAVAKKVLNTPDEVIALFGPISKDEARQVIKRITGKGA